MIDDFSDVPPDLRTMADMIERTDLTAHPHELEDVLLYMGLRDIAAKLANTIDRNLPPEYQREATA